MSSNFRQSPGAARIFEFLDQDHPDRFDSLAQLVAAYRDLLTVTLGMAETHGTLGIRRAINDARAIRPTKDRTRTT